MIKIESFLKMISPNVKKHHMAIYSREKENKKSINILLKLEELNKPNLPVHVNIIRHSKKSFDYDNYIFACKSIRDTIADFLIPGLAPGQADSSPDIYWHYFQKKLEDDKKEKIVIEII